MCKEKDHVFMKIFFAFFGPICIPKFSLFNEKNLLMLQTTILFLTNTTALSKDTKISLYNTKVSRTLITKHSTPLH